MPRDRALAARSHPPLPFGIEPRHVEQRSRGWARSLTTLLLVGVPLLAALLGWLGGSEDEVTTVRSQDVTLTFQSPPILRSGNWFETQVVVEPARDIADLAIAIDQPLWRGMSIDTAIPDAESVETLDGRFTYRFGPVKRGERFLFKIDGQIQPRGLRRLSGEIALLDGENALAALPVAIRVLP